MPEQVADRLKRGGKAMSKAERKRGLNGLGGGTAAVPPGAPHLGAAPRGLMALSPMVLLDIQESACLEAGRLTTKAKDVLVWRGLADAAARVRRAIESNAKAVYYRRAAARKAVAAATKPAEKAGG